MSEYNEELAEFRLEGCKKIIRRYIKKRPVVIKKAEKDGECSLLDHPLVESSEYLFYNHGRPYVVDGIDTAKGWKAFKAQMEKEMEYWNSPCDIIQYLPKKSLMKFTYDACEYLNAYCFDRYLETLISNDKYWCEGLRDDELPGILTDELRDLLNKRQQVNEAYSIDPERNLRILEKDSIYIYRAYPKDESMTVCGLVWNTSWISAVLDCLNADMYKKSQYPITVYKLKVKSGLALYWGDSLDVIVDIDKVKMEDIEKIQVDWELKGALL